jgi:hypothetical protein
MLNKITNSKFLVFIISILIIIGSHVYTLFFFPPTEGWWQAYAYLYNNGFRLYTDVDLAFPPLVIIFNSWILHLTDLFLFNRLIGVLLVVVVFVIFYFFLSKDYSLITAITAALSGILISMYNVVYIPNDYHTFVNVFIVLALLFFSFILRKDGGLFLKGLYSVLFAFSLWGVFFLKQNIGLLLVLGFVLSYIGECFFVEKKTKNIEVLLLILAVVGALFVYTTLLKINILDIYRLTAGNDSKGSVVTVLTRIIADPNNIAFIIKAFLYYMVIVVIDYLVETYTDSYSKGHQISLMVIFVFMQVVFFRDPVNTSVVLALIYIIHLGRELLFKRIHHPLFIPLLALVFANSMTAGLCIAGLFIITPFSFAYVFSHFEKALDTNKYNLIIISFAVVLAISLFVYKQNQPYNWWGLSQGSIAQAKYELPYNSLKYLKVDKATFDLFATIKEVIETKSKTNNDVYLYPDIPIFYQLHNKIPPTRNLVQWYDVISTQAMMREIEDLKKIKPHLIIILEPPWFAYKGHSELKQSNLYQIEIINYLDQQVVKGDYRLIKYQIYSNKIFGNNISDSDMVKITVRVMNPAVFGKTFDELYASNLLVENYEIDNVISHSCDVRDTQRHKLLMGDKIRMRLSYNKVDSMVCKIGTPEKVNEKYYVLRIYEANNE